MQNIVVNMYQKFHDNRSRNDGALGDWKSDNNTKKKRNNVRSTWGPQVCLYVRSVYSTFIVFCFAELIFWEAFYYCLFLQCIFKSSIFQNCYAFSALAIDIVGHAI